MESAQNHQHLTVSADGTAGLSPEGSCHPPATIVADPLDGLRGLADLPADQQDDAIDQQLGQDE